MGALRKRLAEEHHVESEPGAKPRKAVAEGEQHDERRDGRDEKSGEDRMEPACAEKLQDRRFRIGLHCIIDRAIRQGVTEGVEIVAHDIEVDDEARAFRTSGLDEVEDTSSGHRSVPSKSQSSGRNNRRTKGG